MHPLKKNFIHWPVVIKDSGASECFKGITNFKMDRGSQYVHNILAIPDLSSPNNCFEDARNNGLIEGRKHSPI